jgi:hypothetical protein
MDGQTQREICLLLVLLFVVIVLKNQSAPEIEKFIYSEYGT